MTVWCDDCKKDVEIEEGDDGIGHYDYCGAPGYDSRPYICCAECGGQNLRNEEDGRSYDFQDYMDGMSDAYDYF